MYSLLQDYFPADLPGYSAGEKLQALLPYDGWRAFCCVGLTYSSNLEDWVLILSEKKCILNRVWESRNIFKGVTGLPNDQT